MIDVLGELQRQLGRRSDSASATGSLHAKLAQMLAHMTTTVAGRIDANVNSRLGAINSVQRGTISYGTSDTSATATISSVTTSRTTIDSLNATRNAGDDGAGTHSTVKLTSSTVVTVARIGTNSGVSVNYQVIEHAA